VYSIGRLSKKTNISIRALRYYDEIGLLKPAKVAESGYRYYSNEEIETLRHISALKELGFTLASIKELLASGKGTREARWRDYLSLELAAIAEERKRLDEMEKLLLTTRHDFEMKRDIGPEELFLFIRSLSSPPETREAFLARHFTEREIRIIRGLPSLSDSDPRNMEWAKLMREAKERMHEPPFSPASQKLAERFFAIGMEWFEQDGRLLGKYWSLVRPEEGKEPKVFGMDAEAMDYIDRIVDEYLRRQEEGSVDGSARGKAEDGEAKSGKTD